MKLVGHLKKMVVALDTPVQYNLAVGDDFINLNEYIGKGINIKYLNEIECISCGRKTPKSYNQGHCFPCTQKLASCDMCILKPELCHFDKGTCREPQWGKTHCFIPHVVYIANSSNLKVGITRATQVPTRWIDQGATAALPIIFVRSRYQSGLVEKLIAEEISDRTNWRQMLKNEIVDIDLKARRDEIFQKFAQGIQNIAAKFDLGEIELLTNEEITEINYPVTEYPEKIISLNLAKARELSGVIKGMKGQYLIMDTGVINIRSHTAFKVEVTV